MGTMFESKLIHSVCLYCFVVYTFISLLSDIRVNTECMRNIMYCINSNHSCGSTHTYIVTGTTSNDIEDLSRMGIKFHENFWNELNACMWGNG